MPPLHVLLIGLLALGALGQPAAAADAGWQPARTWVFAVGPLEWQDSASFASFPKKDRRDAELVALFRHRGVPESQIVYLQDRAATNRAIASQLERLLDRTRPGDLLVLYYCGHGYKRAGGAGYFASYDAGGDVPGWAMADIPRLIEARFKGSRALLLADCCYSGQLASDVRRLARRVSFACLTSSSASTSSTGNWTFTEALLDALEGRPGTDRNADGSVSLAEMAAHAAADMAVGEEQKTTFLTTGDFAAETALASARARTDERIGDRVEVLSEGKWWTARIVGASSERIQIHWLGFIGYPDEWVTPAHVRPLRAAAGFATGALVEVEWKGRYYPARVLERSGGSHLIHYDGYDEEWDEWVASSRVRRRP